MLTNRTSPVRADFQKKTCPESTQNTGFREGMSFWPTVSSEPVWIYIYICHTWFTTTWRNFKIVCGKKQKNNEMHQQGILQCGLRGTTFCLQHLSPLLELGCGCYMEMSTFLTIEIYWMTPVETQRKSTIQHSKCSMSTPFTFRHVGFLHATAEVCSTCSELPLHFGGPWQSEEEALKAVYANLLGKQLVWIFTDV